MEQVALDPILLAHARHGEAVTTYGSHDELLSAAMDCALQRYRDSVVGWEMQVARELKQQYQNGIEI